MGAAGANVTVPHKRAALSLCDHLGDEAALIGAVNTLSFDADGLVGDNTDAAGLRDALQSDMTIREGDMAVMLGTGGAARAAAVAIARLGMRLHVAGRRQEAVDDIVALASRAGAVGASGSTIDEEKLGEAVHRANLIVNATPLGMHGETLPGPFMRLDAGQVAYDLIYEPPETPFLAAAAAAGATAHHGLGMLVAQAGHAFERWTATPAPLGLMSAAAVQALAERARAT